VSGGAEGRIEALLDAMTLEEQASARAVALARGPDVALLFVRLDGEWDTEGQDRPDLELPSRQNELIERIAAAQPRTVVVLQSGAPVTMSWRDRVAAIAQAWYPGRECGNAIADVLFGKADPGGRLPQSFPARLKDDPAFGAFSQDIRARAPFRLTAEWSEPVGGGQARERAT
jgi:hypothetical protein